MFNENGLNSGENKGNPKAFSAIFFGDWTAPEAGPHCHREKRGTLCFWLSYRERVPSVLPGESWTAQQYTWQRQSDTCGCAQAVWLYLVLTGPITADIKAKETWPGSDLILFFYSLMLKMWFLKIITRFLSAFSILDSGVQCTAGSKFSSFTCDKGANPLGHLADSYQVYFYPLCIQKSSLCRHFLRQARGACDTREAGVRAVCAGQAQVPLPTWALWPERKHR